ncbi:MAG: serpin family protein [Planctomycetes bacterium]|nr:serpin family protein [Planctomycetota bacterium]
MRSLPPLLLLLALTPAAADDAWRPREVPAEDLRAAAAASNRFGLDLLRVVGQGGGDVLVAPPSVLAAFAMTWAGAEGETAAQLARALRVDLPPERGHPALGALLAAGQGSGDPTFAVANRLWGAGEDFLPDFLRRTREAYGAELARVDFRGDPEGARERINGWVAERTRDRIRDLLPESTIDGLTRLVLTNAVYFKGSWKARFDAQATQEGPFTLASGGQVQARLMHQTLTAPFHRGQGFALVELPYAGGRFAMVLVAPDAPGGLPAVERALTADALAGWLAAARTQQVRVVLPRLKLEAEVDLAPVLRALGATDVFDPDRADLSGMNGKKHDLHVTAARHKAFVEVNEEGTEAAAATGVVVGTRSAARPEPAEVRCDRPFLFMIRDRETGLVWFLGRETDPSR